MTPEQRTLLRGIAHALASDLSSRNRHAGSEMLFTLLSEEAHAYKAEKDRLRKAFP